MIERGHVRVDGQTVTRLGTRIDPASEIVVTPAARAVQKALLTVLLNKPPGLVSNQPEKGYREAVSLITRANRDTTCARHVEPLPDHRTLHVAGRLDIDSSGLLVLTQDGRIARQLIGPESNVEKEYAVRLNKIPSESTLTRLNGEMLLDGQRMTQHYFACFCSIDLFSNLLEQGQTDGFLQLFHLHGDRRLC